MDYEVKEDNIEKIVNRIKKIITTKHVHISFDLDSIKSEEFPAVNVAVENIYQDESGISYKTAKKILETLLKELNVCSMDFVEYNPTLDKDKKCKLKIEELLKVIKENL
jgi:arginase